MELLFMLTVFLIYFGDTHLDRTNLHTDLLQSPDQILSLKKKMKKGCTKGMPGYILVYFGDLFFLHITDLPGDLRWVRKLMYAYLLTRKAIYSY